MTAALDEWAAQRLVLIAAAGTALALTWVLSPLSVAEAVVALAAGAVILLRPTLGLCVLVFAIPWGSLVHIPGGGSTLSPVDLAVAGLAAAWLVHGVTRRSLRSFAPWSPYLILYIAAILLSATQATDLAASGREILKWAEVAVVYFAGTTFLRTAADVRLIVAAIVLSGASEALYGFEQVLRSAGPAAFAAQRLVFRAFGTFDQPNPYAGFLNLALPLALAMTIAGPSAVARRWYGLATAVLAGALVLSGSRGALLATLLAVGVMLALAFPAALMAARVLVVALLAGVWLVLSNVISVAPFEQVLSAVGLGNVTFASVTNANFSAVERAAHWLAGVRMFAAHPLLGVGIGNYGAAYPAYHPRGWYASLDHAHNYYINIAAEAGIVGLTMYILLVGSALWYSYVSVRSSTERIFFAASLGVTGAVVATGFHNIFDVLYVHGMAALLGLLMALVTVGLRESIPRVRASMGPGAETSGRG